MRSPGNASFLFTNLNANGSTASITITLRKNAATNLTNVITVTAAGTGIFEDATPHTDAIAAADKLDIQMAATTGTNKHINPAEIGYLFSATTNTVTRLSATSAMSSMTATTSYYSALSGDLAVAQTTDGGTKTRQRKAGTLQNLATHVTSASSSTVHVITLEKNGSTTGVNETQNCTANTAGWYEDTGNTDVVAVDDDWNYKFTTGATVLNLVIGAHCVDFVTTTGIGQCCAGSGGNFAVPISTTFPMSPHGHVPLSTVTEAVSSRKVRDVFTFSEMTIVLNTNTVSAASTLTWRKNQSATGVNETKTITASTAGVFNDASGIDVFTATDQGNYLLVTGGTGTSMTVIHVSIWTTIASAIPLYLQPLFMEWVES